MSDSDSDSDSVFLRCKIRIQIRLFFLKKTIRDQIRPRYVIAILKAEQECAAYGLKCAIAGAFRIFSPRFRNYCFEEKRISFTFVLAKVNPPPPTLVTTFTQNHLWGDSV